MEKIKNYVKYYVYLPEGIEYNRINIKSYFDYKQHAHFKILKNVVNYNLKYMRILIKSLNTYTKHMDRVSNGVDYKKFSELSFEESVDFSSRTVYNIPKYHILNLDSYRKNLIEQYRIFHVLKSLLNGNPLYKIDKNFKLELVNFMFEFLDTQLNDKN